VTPSGWKQTAGVVLGVLALALSSKASFPLPGSPIPVTLQTFALMGVAFLLGPTRGLLCVASHLALLALGAPVAASDRGGLPVLLGPSGGYLLAQLPAVWIAGQARGRGWTSLGFFLLAHAVILLVGTVWLARALDLSSQAALEKGFVPFLPGAVIKSAVPALAAAAWRRT